MESSDPAPQACPPPLMWQDVRREFLAQSEQRFIATSGGRASVRIWGTGPALYLLPAFAAPTELYGLLIWLLRDEFRCVTVERDFTDLQPLAIKPNLTHQTEMLFAVAEELGDEEFQLCGANYGAAWALAVAQQQPARVVRLVLLEGFLHRQMSFFERQLARAWRWSRRSFAALPFREFLQTQNQRRWFPPFDETRWQYYLDATGNIPLKELARRAADIQRFDLRPWAKEIAAPTLVIHTEGEGALAEAAQQEVERLLPNVSSEWLHNTGHLAYLTHPHRLAKLIRNFCADAEHGSQVPAPANETE